jgi:hypothetical protein
VVFLDWDDTLFPSTWAVQQMRREAGKVFMPQHQSPTMKTLCEEIIAFLSEVSRIGHVFIVTASAPGFIAKCCRICFPKLIPVFDELNVNIIYARPQDHEATKESVETWKEIAFSRILQGRSIRPFPPALARFYGAPGWSHILSYGDAWSDHVALRSAAAHLSPESVLTIVKARSANIWLTPSAIASELKKASRLLRHVVCTEQDFPFDFDATHVVFTRMVDLDSEHMRAHVEELIASLDPPPICESLDRPSRVIVGSDLKSTFSSASTNVPSLVPTVAESTPTIEDID